MPPALNGLPGSSPGFGTTSNTQFPGDHASTPGERDLESAEPLRRIMTSWDASEVTRAVTRDGGGDRDALLAHVRAVEEF